MNDGSLSAFDDRRLKEFISRHGSSFPKIDQNIANMILERIVVLPKLHAFIRKSFESILFLPLNPEVKIQISQYLERLLITEPGRTEFDRLFRMACDLDDTEMNFMSLNIKFEGISEGYFDYRKMELSDIEQFRKNAEDRIRYENKQNKTPSWMFWKISHNRTHNDHMKERIEKLDLSVKFIIDNFHRYAEMKKSVNRISVDLARVCLRLSNPPGVLVREFNDCIRNAPLENLDKIQGALRKTFSEHELIEIRRGNR